MCSLLAMPADYDIMVAHSPPVFSHSPPSPYYTGGYATCRSLSPLAARRNRCPSPSSQRQQLQQQQQLNSHNGSRQSCPNSPKPRRPILVLRTPPNRQTSSSLSSPSSSDDSSSDDNGDPLSPTKLKKKVVFADDKGLKLTHVRMLTESPSMPPAWNSQFLMLVTRGVSAEVSPEPWELTFSQPASDYLEFRRRLDEGNVSLENVIVKESEEVVIGTVKVRNLSFEKEVFVRQSTDNWSTNEDAFCTYINNNSCLASSPAVKVLYDTFSFRLTLPPKSRRLEFCVCYRSTAGEFWDNNAGKNYSIVKKGSGGSSDLPQKDLHRSLSSEPMPIPNSQRYIHDTGSSRYTDSWPDFNMFGHQAGVPYW